MGADQASTARSMDAVSTSLPPGSKAALLANSCPKISCQLPTPKKICRDRKGWPSGPLLIAAGLAVAAKPWLRARAMVTVAWHGIAACLWSHAWRNPSHGCLDLAPAHRTTPAHVDVGLHTGGNGLWPWWLFHSIIRFLNFLT